jgi:Fe-S oxidoreductase/nitrate reductase gamma subunit
MILFCNELPLAMTRVMLLGIGRPSGSIADSASLSDSEQITRTIMGNVPGWLAILFYVCVATACTLSAVQFGLRLLKHRRGRVRLEPSQTSSQSMSSRTRSLTKYLFFHEQLLRDRYAGIAHLLLFYGFVILFIGTTLVFLEHDTPLHFFYGTFYLVASLIIDLGGIAFLIGLGMFLYRRMFGKSQRILDRFYVAALVWLLLVIGVTGFLLEGARIAIDRPAFERWSVVGYSVALALNGFGIAGAAAESLHRWMWGFHAAVCIVFFALLPWQFFSHTLYSPISWFLKTKRPISMLRPVALSLTGADRPGHPSKLDSVAAVTNKIVGRKEFGPGATRWEQLSWIDLLHADACTTCGRCNEVCPAQAAGKPLHPREIVLGIRESMTSRASDLFQAISEDAIWSCTTCGACNNACPVGIEVYDKIIELRRGKVEAGAIPARAIRRFESLIEKGNPFERAPESRLAWATGLSVPVAKEDEKIELLYWIGCAGSFDPEGQSVSRSMIKILNHLQLNYRILGKKERCNGDPARRMGEEGLYQEMARETLKTLRSHGVKHVLTHCPHCFNVFQNEYPQVGEVDFLVEHHSQFLARMLEAGRLNLAAIPRPSGQLASEKITFHDPCYLGRGNGETASPRKVLASLPQLELIEMPRHGCNSFCCGAGGGSLWLDMKGNDRIENQRTVEAVETGASLVVTGCPFCKSMIEAGRQSIDSKSRLSETLDLAQLIVTAMRI